MTKKMMLVGIVVALISSCILLPTAKAESLISLDVLTDIGMKLANGKHLDSHDLKTIVKDASRKDELEVSVINVSDISISVIIDGKFEKKIGQGGIWKRPKSLSVPCLEGEDIRHRIEIIGERNGEFVSMGKTLYAYRGMGTSDDGHIKVTKSNLR
ncbi:MAG: hypothetical protein WC297_00740 [Candidatus Paceibacterota bacterium]|jgi:hypothetical protein